MSSKDRIIAGLDIGTTKVCVTIGIVRDGETVGLSANNSTNPSGEMTTVPSIEVVGVGQSVNQGTRKGIVVNIDATTEAIQRAREEAELMAGLKIEDVYVGVAGEHIKSFESKGMIAVRNKEVGPSDVQRVIDAAKAVAVPADREVLHVLPRDFKVDDQGGIFDPIGMSGVRLESSVHIITGGRTALQNIQKCTERAGLKIQGMVLEQLASSISVLTKDERELGVALVDMGGGTCDIVIYVQGAVAYTTTLAIGGSHVTNDVAVGLRTPPMSAENIKKKHGCALASMVGPDETVEVEGVGTRGERLIKRRLLCEVIEPRVEETLNYIQNEIRKSGLSEMIGSGVVLTGGASQLDGVLELAEFIFDMPVRRGDPAITGGLTDVVRAPSFATVVGLLMYGNEQMRSKTAKTSGSKGMFGRLGNRIRHMLDQAF